MTNSSTLSEPSKLPSTDDEALPDDENRGFRVRVVYPILFEYRYAVYPNARDWRVAERLKATIFATETEANEAALVINEDTDIKAVGGKATVEAVPSFDPDWCIAPGAHIVEQCKAKSVRNLGVKLGFSDHEYGELLAGRIVIGRVLATKLTEHLGGSVAYWEALDRNYREGLRMGRSES